MDTRAYQPLAECMCLEMLFFMIIPFRLLIEMVHSLVHLLPNQHLCQNQFFIPCDPYFQQPIIDHLPDIQISNDSAPCILFSYSPELSCSIVLPRSDILASSIVSDVRSFVAVPYSHLDLSTHLVSSTHLDIMSDPVLSPPATCRYVPSGSSLIPANTNPIQTSNNN